ncbi:MAG: EpsI family protein [Rhizorhabdus sp.]|nr:EpsI family protein [Rhizorhabdus sp.]
MNDDANSRDRSGAIFTRRTIIAGGAMAASSVIANLRRPDVPLRMLQPGVKLDSLFPKKVEDWEYEGTNGLILPPPDQLRDRIYNSLLTRYYGSQATLPVMMLIAYSGKQDGVLQVHRPEVCYPAAGYEIIDSHIDPLAVGGGLVIPTHFISARSNSRQEQLIYWTRIGNAFPTRWWQQHVAVAEENLYGHVPDGVLVRISTSAVSDEDAIRVLTRFTQSMLKLISPLARRVLFGDAGAPAPR